MKNLLLLIVTAVTMLLFPKEDFGQVILGPAASRFALYTSSGAITDNASAHSLVTGDVGTNGGGVISGFGNVNGVMQLVAGAPTAACLTALGSTIAQINALSATFFPPSGTLGNGDTLRAGVDSVGNATVNLNLYLDAQNNPNAQFIIKVGGTFGASTNAKVILINGALACNVYWKISGAVTTASLVTLRGNIISGGAITMGSGDSLEGRAFSTAGALLIDGLTIFTPAGCGSTSLAGPPPPNLASTACYTIFSSIGALNGNSTSTSIGDVGNNGGGTVTGWTPANVTGALHVTSDASTILAASDLSKLYDTLNAMPVDIQLLYPVQFGRNLTLTPHVYLMNSAVNGPATLTDSLYLDAQGNVNGIFVIKIINGAFSTSVNSRVKLINGAQAKNVFWMVDGAVSINSGSIFRGTIIVSAGAINLVTGVTLDGRALTKNGAITTAGLAATMPPGCLSGSTIITTEPVIQTSCIGDTAKFIVIASGTSLTYQWRKGNVNLVNGGHISGATSDTLRIFPVSAADTSSFYNVIVFGSGPTSDTSIYASLKLNSTVITSQPTNQLACVGDSAKFSITATGTGITYQWRKGLVNLINGVNITGATSDTLRFNSVAISDTASNYNVIITGTCAPKDSSINVSLKLNNPVIISQPTNQLVCVGSSARFSVTTTGTGITYQWRKGLVNLINGINITGATSDTLRFNSVAVSDTASNYNVIITGACLPKDSSINVSLKLNNPVITSQPTNQLVCVGSSARFSVTTTGTGITYQWRKGLVNLINGINITGATSDTLRFNSVSVSDTASNYNVIITGACLPKDSSINVSLKLNSPVITSQPANQLVCVGSTARFSVTTTGTGITYQWRKGLVNLINGINITGATSDTLRFNSVSVSDTASNYNVIITGACLPKDSSINVSLKLNSPVITTQPASQLVCVGSTARFSVTTTGTGITYQWRKGLVNLINGVNITGATSDTLRFNAVAISDTASNYNVIITGTCLPKDSSINVYLRTNAATIITTAPANQTACLGSSTGFSVTALGASLTYQWRKGIVNLSNAGNISGATSASLVINPVAISDTSSYYNVVISSTCAANITSSNVSLMINAATIITTAPANQTACIGSSTGFSVTASGAGLTYQWRKGLVNLTNSGNISGATSASLVINPVAISDTSSYYNVVISSTCAANITSSNVSLMINAATIITTAPANQTACIGSSTGFSVTASGAGLTYQWRKGLVNLTNSGNISGATSASLVINPVAMSDTSSYYNVVISSTCAANITSSNVSLTLNAATIITTSPANQAACVGSSTGFSVTATGSGLTYQWRKGIVNLSNTGNITGATSASLVINPVAISDTSSYYNVVISSTCAAAITSANLILTVNAIPVAIANSNSPVCAGSPINLTAQTVAGATYNWTGPNGFTSLVQNPVITPSSAINSGSYSLTVINNGCTSTASSVSVTVNNCNTDLSIVKTVNNAHPIVGQAVVFTLTATNNGTVKATGVVVIDILQSGYTFVSSTATKGTYTPSNGKWIIDTLNGGSSAILTITATVNATGNYTNTSTISGNQGDTVSVNDVSVVETYPTDFFIPGGFSPNNDGTNDLFVIRGIEAFPGNTFTVFNRWGNKVFDASPYHNNWDGRSTSGLKVGGDELPVGTYFYILDLGDGSDIFKGTIYLNK